MLRGKLTELVDILDREHFIAIARAGTRLLVALELPEVKQMIQQKKEEVKRVEVREELKNTSIENVIAVQNLWSAGRIQSG